MNDPSSAHKVDLRECMWVLRMFGFKVVHVPICLVAKRVIHILGLLKLPTPPVHIS